MNTKIRLATYGVMISAHRILAGSMGISVLMLLTGCPQTVTDVQMISASVEPTVVPAPTAGAPSSFKLIFRAGGDDLNVRLNLVKPGETNATNDVLVTTITCANNECRDQDRTRTCRSALNPTNPNLRDINCDDYDGKFLTKPPGNYAVRFHASTLGAGIAVKGDTDEISVPIEIK